MGPPRLPPWFGAGSFVTSTRPLSHLNCKAYDSGLRMFGRCKLTHCWMQCIAPFARADIAPPCSAARKTASTNTCSWVPRVHNLLHTSEMPRWGPKTNVNFQPGSSSGSGVSQTGGRAHERRRRPVHVHPLEALVLGAHVICDAAHTSCIVMIGFGRVIRERQNVSERAVAQVFEMRLRCRAFGLRGPNSHQCSFVRPL